LKLLQIANAVDFNENFLFNVIENKNVCADKSGLYSYSAALFFQQFGVYPPIILSNEFFTRTTVLGILSHKLWNLLLLKPSLEAR